MDTYISKHFHEHGVRLRPFFECDGPNSDSEGARLIMQDASVNRSEYVLHMKRVASAHNYSVFLD